MIRNAAPVDFLSNSDIKKTKSEKSLGFARGIVENRYLPLIGLYENTLSKGTLRTRAE